MGMFYTRSPFKSSLFDAEQILPADAPKEATNDANIDPQEQSHQRWYYLRVIDANDDLPYVTVRPKPK